MLDSIPRAVRQVALPESDCKNLFLCSLTSKSILEVIPIDALAALSEAEASEKVEDVSAAEAGLTSQQGEDVKISPPREKTQDEEWKLVYDLMRADKRGIFFLREHVSRFMESLETVSPYPLPSYARDFIQSCLQEYATVPNGGHNPNLSQENATFEEDQNLKVVMWLKPGACSADCACPPGEKPDQLLFIIYFIKSFFPPPEWYVEGTQFALLFNARRQNPRLKVMQPQLIHRVKQLRERSGAFEVMLVHDETNNFLVPESSRSNYLLISESGKILCSEKDHILMGVTLIATNRAAVRAGLSPIEHRNLTLKDVCSSYSLVMLGTSPGVLPVRELLLFYDAESKANFCAAAIFLGIEFERMKNFKTISSDPPRAVIEFAVQSNVIDRLMNAYEEEKFL
ncbi:unnamed protein product [Phytomonas sp. EM1]|nr:unnamed protein product [Phytomonas sp. EM1]|eukprot:CCW60640.1 unnamed protein product [Phytomonas sp. isolate EM1]